MKREGPATAFLIPCGQSGPKLDKLKLQASNDNSYQYQAARLNVGVMGGGRWYHEVTIDAGNPQQCLFGFAMADVANGLPLGQNELSWGWDGMQRQWAGKSEAFGSGFKQGDVLGFSLDLDLRKAFVTLNGKPVGTCFSDLPRDRLLYPALSLRAHQRATLNVGATPFRFPDKLAFPWHSPLNDKQKLGLEKLYEHYKKVGAELSESGEDHGDVIKADGVFQFATDAGAADDADPLLLVVAHKLHCEHPWELSREEWMRGFSLFGLHDIAGIKAAAAKWKQETLVNDPELFRNFYCWTFDYLRDERKILSIDEVKTLWSMLGMAGRWKLWQQWLDFLLGKKKREYLSKDEFTVIYTFLTEYPNGIEEYDESGPWPVLLDDFVAFCRGEE